MPARMAPARTGRKSAHKRSGENKLDKAPDAFRTISEVADEVNVPQHVLRFWESRFAQIRPLKRGGGRRYYRPEDIDLLRGVRHLLYGEGYTIRGVQRILREEGLAFVQSVWRTDAQALPETDEADEELESSPVTREEPRFFATPSSQPTPPPLGGRVEPALRPAAAPQPSPAQQTRAPDQDDRQKLRAVLDELSDCRRVLEAAIASAPA
jgi:DNA-binding transcriptional MerR regulator